jgi:hypothetical protein
VSQHISHAYLVSAHTFKSRAGVAIAALILIERLKNVDVAIAALILIERLKNVDKSLTEVHSILNIPKKKVKRSKVR